MSNLELIDSVDEQRVRLFGFLPAGCELFLVILSAIEIGLGLGVERLIGQLFLLFDLHG